MSASNVGDVTSLTGGVSTQSAGGNTQVVSLSGGVSTMSSSGATTCYKKKTCEEGGYYSSEPTNQKCSPKKYNGYTCYISCSYKTCSDYGYKSSIPSGQTCTPVEPRDGLTCYKDCKAEIYWPEEYYVSATICNTGSPSTTCWLDGEGLTGELQYSYGRSSMNGYNASDFVIYEPNGTYIYIVWSGGASGSVHLGELKYHYLGSQGNYEYILEGNCSLMPQRPCSGSPSQGFTCPNGWGGVDKPTGTFMTQYANFSETMTQVTLKYVPTGATKKVDLKLNGSIREGGDVLGGACR